MTETATRTRPAGRRALSTAVSAGIVGAFMLAGTATDAQAAPQAPPGSFTGSEPEITGPVTEQHRDDQGGGNNSMMYGAHIPTGGPAEGNRLWCGDAGLDWPYADAFDESSSEAIEAPNLAFVLYRYDRTFDDPAEQMANDMAVSSYMKLADEVDHRNLFEPHSPAAARSAMGFSDGQGRGDHVGEVLEPIGGYENLDGVIDRAQEIYDDILVAVDELPEQPAALGVNLDEDDETVSVTLTGTEGNEIPGYELDLSLDGAEFADGGAEKTFDSTGETSVFDIDASGAGEVSAEVALEIPPTEVIRWRPLDYEAERAANYPPGNKDDVLPADGYTRYSVQDMYERQDGDEMVASTSFSRSNEPSVVTTISDHNLKPGDQVYDEFEVTGLVDDETVDVDHELWYSPVKPEQTTTEPQDGHELVGEITSEGVGNGEHRTDETAGQLLTIPEDLAGGYFYWRESIEPGEFTDGWDGEYGIPGETGFVPYTPAGETQLEFEGATVPEADENEAADGDDVDTANAQPTDEDDFATRDAAAALDELPAEGVDHGRITGGMPGQTLTVTLEAYQDHEDVLAQSSEVPESAEFLEATTLEVTLDENGNGSYETDTLALAESLAEPGESTAVTLVETIAETDYNESTTSDYGIPSESVVIELDEPETPDEPDEPDNPETPDEPEKPKNPVVKTGGADKSGLWSTILGLFA
jgi:hypothetical protein